MKKVKITLDNVLIKVVGKTSSIFIADVENKKIKDPKKGIDIDYVEVINKGELADKVNVGNKIIVSYDLLSVMPNVNDYLDIERLKLAPNTPAPIINYYIIKQHQVEGVIE